MCEVLSHSVELGTLPASTRTGLIKLICKDESRKGDLSAWRPITLLNADYKICAKALQLRLSRIIDMIISPAQASSVPGRSIQQHLFALRDVCYWAADRRAEVFLMSIDQEKAFDRVDHSFLFYVIRRAGLGERFLQQVQALYSGAESMVLVNGRPSEPFPIQRGVRQGCPLSPVLYILTFEAVIRRLSDMIPRVRLPGSQRFPLLFAFADDLTVCLPTGTSVRAVLDCLHIYGRASGAKVNERKSSIMALQEDFPYSDVWGIPVVHSARILGIHFNRRGPLTSNWMNEIRHMRDTLHAVGDRECGYRQRRTFVARHICSKFWFHGTAFQPSAATARRIHSLIFHFFWNGRPERVRREVLMRTPERGGWKIPDVALFCGAMGLSALLKLLQDRSHIASDLAIFFLRLTSSIGIQPSYMKVF